MPRNGRWTSEDDLDIPLTPLIDIIFILIVFFLVATTFYSEERDMSVKLPEGTEGDAVSTEDKILVINIRESGVIVVDSEILSMDQLEPKLESAAAAKGQSIEIRGDTNARHGTIMDVMNLCRKLGISDYALTQRTVRDAE
ncbi:MAG: ExbD/TolR family protein [Verrucomicrobiota bacterium]